MNFASDVKPVAETFIKLLSHVYKIQWMDVVPAGVAGTAGLREEVICLALEEGSWMQTLVHELVHIIADLFRIDLQEDDVERLAQGLHSVMVDNGMFNECWPFPWLNIRQSKGMSRVSSSSHMHYETTAFFDLKISGNTTRHICNSGNFCTGKFIPAYSKENLFYSEEHAVDNGWKKDNLTGLWMCPSCVKTAEAQPRCTGGDTHEPTA